jgi:hydroxymethylpyrimidine/phosphomethylpyrimidine kinase
VLTIAGADCSGGAGIQADLKTFAALGCYGTSVVTVITAQNTRGIQSLFPLPPSIVKEQLDAIFSDIGTDAVKIGMLFDTKIIEVISNKLAALSPIPIVLDPVMYAKGGHPLLKQEALHTLKKMFPLCYLMTPNLTEASELLGYRIDRKEQMEKAAFDLLEMGAQHVLLKGGHLPKEQGSDFFCSKTGEAEWIIQPPIQTKNTHGTGCTLSSSIAAFLAKKYPLKKAIGEAKHFLHGALLAGAEYELGAMHGPLHHFYGMWGEACAR